MKAPVEFADQAAQAKEVTAAVRAEVAIYKSVEATPIVTPFLLPQARVLSARLAPYERYLLPAVRGFSDADRRMTCMMRSALRDVGWAGGDPVVVTDSRNYYNCLAYLRVLHVPDGEEGRLLRLPDLFHEIGHLLIHDGESEIFGDFNERVAYYSADLQVDPSAPQPVEFYDDLTSRWSGTWRNEFACDIVGVYLCGSSYATQHIALAASGLAEPFESGISHPADDARATNIAKALDLLGFTSEANTFRGRWRDFCSAVADSPAAGDFDDSYPQALLDDLVETVLGALERGPLHGFDEASGGLPALIAEAWLAFVDDPETYAEWEKKALKGFGKASGCW